MKVLVVEDQPIASVLFAEEGYTVEKRSHAEMIGTEAQHVNGEIKRSRFSAVEALVADISQNSATQESSTMFEDVGDVVPNSGTHWHSRVLARAQAIFFCLETSFWLKNALCLIRIFF